ncbi:MAG: hypothetical protein NZL98_09275, partial [Anaerolineales bacterium]|nr:hypothetical protein [Anaerolineales bacterium]
MAVELASLTVSRALRLLYARELTATALIEACLEQIKHLNPSLNAILTVMLETAKQASLQADAFYGSYPSLMGEPALAGIP